MMRKLNPLKKPHFKKMSPQLSPRLLMNKLINDLYKYYNKLSYVGCQEFDLGLN